ncbi:MAG TPA: DUF4388 domain-containing protein [Acidobacteriota bacterium]|nr:DUF4388 domain-containing protein [Acidobacteriota bacterium]HMZ82002.1 DUF4388 domain-containing protein [Acidobacteriota bacterium]HNB71512.1 DUF4388 domain-containing protein [Acidobacteriota bacterium]HND20548.1 DUF4388 domain-containing protein [Acidobacteriota bacterium]HNG91279.1 DUF4388 domain-containing protein [Acidobacteriota bacterium]
MTDAFSGNLSQLKLIDVLRLLHASNRTGLLELTHDDGRTGEIYIESGQISHAMYEEYIGEEAIYNLFSWGAGMFRFRSGEVTDERTTSISTEEILLECVTYATEWESIRRVIPSPNTIFRLRSSWNQVREVSLRAEDWMVIQNMDGLRTVAEIAEITQLNELYTSKVIVRLFDLGLVEFVGEQEPEEEIIDSVPEELLLRIEKELTRAIGPMGPIVLDDSAESLGFKRSQLPRDMMPALAERLAEEIPDTVRRVNFQEAMLEIMQKLYE